MGLTATAVLRKAGITSPHAMARDGREPRERDTLTGRKRVREGEDIIECVKIL